VGEERGHEGGGEGRAWNRKSGEGNGQRGGSATEVDRGTRVGDTIGIKGESREQDSLKGKWRGGEEKKRGGGGGEGGGGGGKKRKRRKEGGGRGRGKGAGIGGRGRGSRAKALGEGYHKSRSTGRGQREVLNVASPKLDGRPTNTGRSLQSRSRKKN